MVRSRLRVGEGLVALTEQLPHADAHEIWTEDETHPVEAAVAAPFLRRMRALLALMDAGARAGVVDARRTLREAASMTHLQHRPPELLETDLLHAAVRHGLVRCDEREGDQPAPWSESASLRRGARAHLVAGHPLAGRQAMD
jgi:hypothetical protein